MRASIGWLQGCEKILQPGMFEAGRGQLPAGWELASGKFAVLASMLARLHAETDDRIVIVSNYTQTLDLIAQLCRERQVSPAAQLHPAAPCLTAANKYADRGWCGCCAAWLCAMIWRRA